MAIIDIRGGNKEEINCIIFHKEQTDDDVYLAYRLVYDDPNFPNVWTNVWIGSAVDSVFIENKEHAQNLIKALNKAIELGWLK